MADREPYDDLETDYLEEENEGGQLSLVSVVLCFFAVAGFIWLAWYAYRSSTDPMMDENVEVVEAQEGDYRTQPAEPGGWQFPHQEKTVYNVISGEEDKTKVEQILPEPEKPVKRDEESTETWMNEDLKQDPIAKTDAERQKEASEQVSETTPPVSAAEEQPSTAKPVAAPVETSPVVSTEPVEAGPVTEEAERAPIAEVETAEPVREEKPKPAPVIVATKPTPVAKEVASASSARVQLGAYQSNAEARNSWNKISGKHGSILSGKNYTIEQADVAGKGTFYRLQVTPFSSMDDAKRLCGQLSAAGQACFPIKR